MKKLTMVLLLTFAVSCFASNEIVVKKKAPSITSFYVVVEQQGTKYLLTEATPAWDSTPTTGEWGNYDIALTEDSVLVGDYYGNMPAISAGIVIVNLYQGSPPASTDTRIDSAMYYWTGTYLLDASAVLTVESTDATTYIESRTLATASYFDPAADTVATVTDVTNGATAAALATAQADLDILTGTDGVTLGTLQPNYSPTVVSDLSGLSTFDPLTDEVDIGKVNGVAVTDINDFKASSTFDPATDEVIIKFTVPTGDPSTWTGDEMMYWLYSRLAHKYERDRTNSKVYIYDENDSKISQQSYSVTSSSEIINGIQEPN